jgi:hypothetical protein
MNVIRAGRSWGCAKNVDVLKKQLGAADERFEVGEITRTDVAAGARQ